MKYIAMLAAALSGILLNPALAADPEQTRQRLQQFQRETKTGAGARLGPQLLAVHKAYTQRRGLDARGGSSAMRRALRQHDTHVLVSAQGADPASLRAQLTNKGMLNATLHGGVISGRVPIASLLDIAQTAGLRSLELDIAVTNAGLVTTQADRASRADRARRRFAVDGSGIRIGVLSDSFDCAPGAFVEGQPFTRAAQDVLNGDLPAGIHVLADLSPVPNDECSDEGRALMQIIHDIAPGAELSFHSAFLGSAAFAEGIRELADDGAQVIVDDVGLLNAPMFENGIVAQAVNEVVARGVAYFSSAGNYGRQSYAAPFRKGAGIVDPFGEVRHDFDAGRATDGLQQISAPPQTNTLLILNWDQPSISANGSRGSQSDVDVFFYDEAGNLVDFCQTADQLVCQIPGSSDNIGRGNANEFATLINTTGETLIFNIGIGLYTGPLPQLMKYVWVDFDFGTLSVDEYATASGTIFGHANAEGAEAVGAAWWFETAAFNEYAPACLPACVNPYSSAGGTPLLFDRNGVRRRVPWLGFKPGVTGVDGGNTSFFFVDQGVPIPGTSEPDGFPNFYGTSASAPQVAAVAALMLDARRRSRHAGGHGASDRRISPHELYSLLRSTAGDIRLRDVGPALQPIERASGFDFDSGFGFVNAERAVGSVGH